MRLEGTGALRLALAAGLALAVVFALAPSLDAPFQFDDWADIVANPAAHAATFLSELPTTVRPLLKASYALTDLLFGLRPFGYHLGNLLLHLLATGLAFGLARRAAAQAGYEPDEAAWIGLATAGIWGLHPAATESVIYVSGRSAVLSGVLALGALLAATGARPSAGALIAAGVLAFLAPLARETALVLAFLLLWWQLTVQPREPASAMLRRALPVWAGAALAALVLLAMPRQRALLSFSLEARTPLEALRANLHAIVEMLAFWPMPWRISIDPASPVAGGWLSPDTLLKGAGLAAAAAVALVLRRRWPILALGIGWTLLAVLPSNSLVWRLDPVGLRPLYLAGIGLSLLLAVVLLRLDRWRWPIGTFVAVALCATLAFATTQRASLYRSTVALWEDAVAKAPGKGRAWTMLGGAYLAEGRNAEAEAAFEAALDVAPWLVEAERGLDLARERAAPP
jgi:hypothetical protein